MKRIFLILILIMISMLAFSDSNAQGFTPPKVVYGISLDGNFAASDAHGSNFIIDPYTYGMIWGRGLSIYSKIGLDLRKKHRLTIGATYNKMINREGNSGIPFFQTVPSNSEERYTNNNIWTGALGYEYAFNPRCQSKQYIGFSVTFNYLTTASGSYIQFDPSFRVGALVSTGYEFVLDKNFKYGLNIGMKYHLLNLLGVSNGDPGKNLNDGAGVGGASFWRKIEVISLHLGFNIYTGVEPYRGIK